MSRQATLLMSVMNLHAVLKSGLYLPPPARMRTLPAPMTWSPPVLDALDNNLTLLPAALLFVAFDGGHSRPDKPRHGTLS